jgi:hypothetical protein
MALGKIEEDSSLNHREKEMKKKVAKKIKNLWQYDELSFHDWLMVFTIELKNTHIICSKCSITTLGISEVNVYSIWIANCQRMSLIFDRIYIVEMNCYFVALVCNKRF